MAVPGLTIIGESINDSVSSTRELMDKEDLSGLCDLARRQVEGGAAAVDVNVGRRGATFMKRVIEAIQAEVRIPLAIDAPDLEVLQAGLDVYDPQRAGGPAILNSISDLRREGLALRGRKPCRVILLLTERRTEDGGTTCRNAEEEYQTARSLYEEARSLGYSPDDIFFDPGIMPAGADTEGRLQRTLRTLELIHGDPELRKCHASVGLSNFTVMLPRRRPDGRPIRSSLESAFLTLAMPLGLDTIIGSVKRKYELLSEDDPAVRCLKDMISSGGFEAIARLDRYCKGQDD